MTKRTPDQIKTAVADVAFSRFRSGTDIVGVSGYDIVLNDPLQLVIRIDPRAEGAGPRYFTITVKEQM